jgi:hypothetical protein
MRLRRSQFLASAASSPYASYALALDFKSGSYWQGGSKAATLAAIPGYSFTRTGGVAAVDGSGAVQSFAANVPAIISGVGYETAGTATNLLLNAGSSSNLSSQSVTVTAQAYTLAIMGTGSVALSGAATGTLNGTGAGNQVALNFTPTAGTLTLTVTGSVTYAVLVTGTRQAPYVPIIPTAGAVASVGGEFFGITPPITTDQDFVFYGVLTLDPSDGNDRWWFGMGDGTLNNGIFLKGGFTSITAFEASGAVQNVAASGVGYGSGGRFAMLYRRKAGKFSCAVRDMSGPTVTITAETATTFPAGINSFRIGNFNSGNSYRTPLMSGLFIQTGTFSDAQVTALLQGLA